MAKLNMLNPKRVTLYMPQKNLDLIEEYRKEQEEKLEKNVSRSEVVNEFVEKRLKELRISG